MTRRAARGVDGHDRQRGAGTDAICARVAAVSAAPPTVPARRGGGCAGDPGPWGSPSTRDRCKLRPRPQSAPTASHARAGGARGDQPRPQQRWGGDRSAWPSPAPGSTWEAGAPSRGRKRMEVPVGGGDPAAPDGPFSSGSPPVVAATGAAGILVTSFLEAVRFQELFT